MNSFTRKGDFWAGLVLAGLGIFIVTQAWGWSYMTEEGPGPGFFPLWYGTVMVGLSRRIAKSMVTDLVAVKAAYDALLLDKDFVALVSQHTSDDSNVKQRLQIATLAFADI